MGPKSDILHNRAPETRQVLAKISGWALNWATSLLGLLFLVAIFAATQISFDVKAQSRAEVNPNGTLQLNAPIDVTTGQKILVKATENTFEIAVAPGEEQTRLHPKQPLPPQISGQVLLEYETQVSLLGAVFNGIF